MSIVFNADEVLQIAEQIERNGASFYRKAAQHTPDANARQMLLDLAQMEDDHEKTFADMRLTLSQQQKTTTVFDPEDQAGKYLNALADRRVFDITADPTDKLTGSESLEEVLRIAIDAEKDSIVFYVGIKDMVPEKLGKGRVDGVINEEMGHITLLSTALGSAGS